MVKQKNTLPEFGGGWTFCASVTNRIPSSIKCGDDHVLFGESDFKKLIQITKPP